MMAASPSRQPSPAARRIPPVQVHEEIGDAEHGDRRRHGEVAPIARADDFAGGKHASTKGKLTSMAAASPKGSHAEIKQAIRPASHSRARHPSKAPWIGLRPVQFGIAVSMKPAMAASTKPNSIS